MDAVTTSGPGTGYAADIEKIRRMKQALGNTPLAIASGITPENIVNYLPHADCFLVATEISRNFTELDPVKCGPWFSESDPSNAERTNAVGAWPCWLPNAN